MGIGSWFGGKASEDKTKEEIILPWSPEITVSYSWKQHGEQYEVDTPVFVLPLKRVETEIRFRQYDGNGLTDVPFGFVQHLHYGTVYYKLEREFFPSVEEDKGRPGTLYFPTLASRFKVSLGKYDEKHEFVESSGSPFELLTINGDHSPLPMLLVGRGDNLVEARTVYKNSLGQVDMYIQSNLTKTVKENILDLLSDLESGRYGAPEPIKGAKIRKSNSQETEDQVETKTTIPEIETTGEFNWENPKSIKSYLDQFVVGQEEGKKTVAVAFSNYMTRKNSGNEDLPRDNILLLGPSGVGKTYMISLLAKKAELPWAQAKLTGKSTEGYKGENLSLVFGQIRAKTKEEKPYGVVFLDEIDKLARDNWGSGSGFGPRLQDELIGWLEDGTVVEEGGKWTIDTGNLLFVTAGAFQGQNSKGLEDIIKKREGKQQAQLGFGAKVGTRKENGTMLNVTPEDLIAYGLKPELLGRLPSVGVLLDLTTEDKIKILKEASGSRLHQYRALFKAKGFELKLEPEVYEAIVEATPSETGARALNAVCNELFTEFLFDPKQFSKDGESIVVTQNDAYNYIQALSKKKEKAKLEK